MELLTSLPPDLAVLADPLARGPAPFKRPPDADGAQPAPFELLLGLLTALPPSGEPWPDAGKELPVVPESPEAEVDAAGELAPKPVLTFAPIAFADTAIQARLRAAETPAAPATAALPLPQPASTLPLPPTPSGTPPVAPEPVTPNFAGSAALAVLTANGAEALPFERADAEASTATAKPTSAQSWLQAFTAQDGRLQRPLTAAPIELPLAAAPPVTATPAVANLATAAVAATAVESSWAAQSAARRAEVPKLLAAVAAAGESASPSTSAADWLPPPGTPGGAPHAVAAPTVPVAAQPVDTRSPGWHEAFASRVQYLVDTQVGEARIKLNPPELGAVDVKISLVDDKTYVHLTTATAAARDELAQSLPRLRELFTVSGLELGGASVHNGRDGHHSGHGHGTDSAAAVVAPLLSLAGDLDDAPTLAPRLSLGRIDVFA